MTTNATIPQLELALQTLNIEYDGNISFENIEQRTKNKVQFTLKAKSGMKGARYSHSGRKLPKASWHVHGKLFDLLFSIDQSIYVDSLGKRITKYYGNWEDSNIGSVASPKYFSETSIED